MNYEKSSKKNFFNALCKVLVKIYLEKNFELNSEANNITNKTSGNKV